MTKTEVIDDIIEMLLKKAMDELSNDNEKNIHNRKNKKLRGEKKNGIYPSNNIRKQA